MWSMSDLVANSVFHWALSAALTKSRADIWREATGQTTAMTLKQGNAHPEVSVIDESLRQMSPVLRFPCSGLRKLTQAFVDYRDFWMSFVMFKVIVGV